MTNDRFDPLRPGAEALADALAEASARRAAPPEPGPRPALAPPHRLGPPRGALVAPGRPPRPIAETALLAWAAALLERYGVLARETAALDPWAPPWRDLVPWLARAELRGELRRGYFVEGLSGVQYATDEAAEELARRAGRPGPGRRTGLDLDARSCQPLRGGRGVRHPPAGRRDGAARRGRRRTIWSCRAAGPC